MLSNKGYKLENYSFGILLITCALASIGLIVLQSITVESDTNMFLKQLLGLFAGIGVMVLVSLVDYKIIIRFCVPLYIFNIVLMLICRFVTRSISPIFYGKSIDEAKRWIHIGGEGGLEFMPSEITKLVIIVSLARMLYVYEGKLNQFSTLAIIVVVIMIPILFVFLQPDLSTTIVISATFVIMLFIGGLTYKIVIPAGISVLGILYAFIWYVQQDYSSLLLKKWQRDRILSLLRPEEYPDLMYQQNNSCAAIQSGDIFGKMIIEPDSPRLTKYVPVVESDFIFSAVGEELGFVGTFVVLALFVAFLFLSFKIALNARDKMGSYMAAGIAVLITFQAFVNIGVVISIIPNTGIPLPFMSNGLSSLLTNFFTVGILLNIGLQNKSVNAVGEDVIVFSKYHKEES